MIGRGAVGRGRTPTSVSENIISVSSRSQASPAAADRLRTLPRVRLDRLPRMADFAIWATACETAFWSNGTFARCYETNRRSSIDDVVDADPVAACVREIMATRSAWTGSATELQRAGAGLTDDGVARANAGWPKNPRALAGRLRRAQTFLRAVGVDIAFSREGRVGNRAIRMRATRENTVGTVSSGSKVGSRSAAAPPPPQPASSVATIVDPV
jgi:hypothetical protein